MNQWEVSHYDEWAVLYDWTFWDRDPALAYVEQLPLDIIRADFFDMIQPFQKERVGLRAALVEGRIEGTLYGGECCCLVGTIAKLGNHPNFDTIPNLAPDQTRPAELFAVAIHEGDTPENNPVSKQLIAWIDEFDAMVENYNALFKS